MAVADAVGPAIAGATTAIAVTVAAAIAVATGAIGAAASAVASAGTAAIAAIATAVADTVGAAIAGTAAAVAIAVAATIAVTAAAVTAAVAAVEPKTKADQEKMGLALNRLAQEDPSFRVQTDEESGQTIISGMGELHLEILVDRMKREFGVEATVGKPQVAYRETVRTTAADVEGKFVKQSGGRGQYGHAVITLEPNPGKGYEFLDEIKGGVIPREFIPAVDKGITETLKSGVLAGYPVVDVKVHLTFGSYHDVDSNENAFRMAGSMAFKEAMRKAKPVLLEPMMAVEVETPEEFMGNVMGDLSSRRGIVQGMEDIAGGGGKLVRAEVPLAEMFGYSTSLRSATQGRATYTMEFKQYAETPANVSEGVISAKTK